MRAAPRPASPAVSGPDPPAPDHASRGRRRRGAIQSRRQEHVPRRRLLAVRQMDDGPVRKKLPKTVAPSGRLRRQLNRRDACLRQREQFGRLGHAVVVGIDPEPELTEDGVGRTDQAVAVAAVLRAVEAAEVREAVRGTFRVAPAAHRLPKQLPQAVDHARCRCGRARGSPTRAPAAVQATRSSTPSPLTSNRTPPATPVSAHVVARRAGITSGSIHKLSQVQRVRVPAPTAAAARLLVLRRRSPAAAPPRTSPCSSAPGPSTP